MNWPQPGRLLRLGRALEASYALEQLLNRAPQSPEVACGLAGLAEAYDQLGRPEDGRSARERLEREFPGGYRSSP